VSEECRGLAGGRVDFTRLLPMSRAQFGPAIEHYASHAELTAPPLPLEQLPQPPAAAFGYLPCPIDIEVAT